MENRRKELGGTEMVRQKHKPQEAEQDVSFFFEFLLHLMQSSVNRLLLEVVACPHHRRGV